MDTVNNFNLKSTNVLYPVLGSSTHHHHTTHAQKRLSNAYLIQSSTTSTASTIAASNNISAGLNHQSISSSIAAVTTTSNDLPPSSSAAPATSENAPQQKWVTREIAALDFLLNIPLAAERSIVRCGLSGQPLHRGGKHRTTGNKNERKEEEEPLQSPPLEVMVSAAASAAAASSSLSSQILNHNSNHQPATTARWWEKFMNKDKTSSFFTHEAQMLHNAKKRAQLELEEKEELELPDLDEQQHHSHQPTDDSNYHTDTDTTTTFSLRQQEQHRAQSEVPGRRLGGCVATLITIPPLLRVGTGTTYANKSSSNKVSSPENSASSVSSPSSNVVGPGNVKDVARRAETLQWERKLAHGIGRIGINDGVTIAGGNSDTGNNSSIGALLDGRLFFSSGQSYPMGIFSVIKYEPKKEEHARRRKKLEEKGGGGSTFIIPTRDWRGVSYAQLLRWKDKNHKRYMHEYQPHLSTCGRVSTISMSSNNNRMTQDQQQQRLDSKTTRKDSGNFSDVYNGSITAITSNDDSRQNTNRNIINDVKTGKNGTDSSDNDDVSSIISSSSGSSSDEGEGEEDEGGGYVPGFLDDPQMVQGRHRNVMVGDRVTGPILLSTIQFVKPADLKADLNKQYRERFDGWEPPKSQLKMIGARVVGGVYTLIDPTVPTAVVSEENGNQGDERQENGSRNGTIDAVTKGSGNGHKRSNSSYVNSNSSNNNISNNENSNHDNPEGNNNINQHRQRHLTSSVPSEQQRETIRMPPSLTLSKIRSLKQQALMVSLRSNLEISTVALAFVYFERLCLDCRVDKSNRHLSFAACLLLACKSNEEGIAISPMKEQPQRRNKKGYTGNNVSSSSSTVDKKDSNNTNEMLVTTKKRILNSIARPTKKSTSVFANLLEFFTHEWNLSLKDLFGAEWGVFVALGFHLHEKPSHVAFHYKRIMKALERNRIAYLGKEMHDQWQDVLLEEAKRQDQYEERGKLKKKRKERKLLKLQRDLQRKQQQQERQQQHQEPHHAGKNDHASSRVECNYLPPNSKLNINKNNKHEHGESSNDTLGGIHNCKSHKIMKDTITPLLPQIIDNEDNGNFNDDSISIDKILPLSEQRSFRQHQQQRGGNFFKSLFKSSSNRLTNVAHLDMDNKIPSAASSFHRRDRPTPDFNILDHDLHQDNTTVDSTNSVFNMVATSTLSPYKIMKRSASSPHIINHGSHLRRHDSSNKMKNTIIKTKHVNDNNKVVINMEGRFDTNDHDHDIKESPVNSCYFFQPSSDDENSQNSNGAIMV